MLRALSQCLAGRDVPAVGQVPAALELPLSGLLGTLNRLPTAAQEWAYAASGWGRGHSPAQGRERCVRTHSLRGGRVTIPIAVTR